MIAQLQQSASVKEFISDAVQSGKVVTIHEKTLSMSGWTGAGYSVIDPDTGAGGYLIEGKGNGGVFATFGSSVLGVVGMYVIQSNPLIGAYMMSLALHIVVIALADLMIDGVFDPEKGFLGAAGALSLLRALSALFKALNIFPGFSMPNSVLLGVILVALSVWGLSKLGRSS